MAKSKKTPYYAVMVGRNPGVYNSWDAALKEVSGFKGAVHKKFYTFHEAQCFVNGRPVSTASTTGSVRDTGPTRVSKPSTQKKTKSTFYGINYADGTSKIVTTWPECQKAVRYQQGVTYKKFDTLEQAKEFTSRGETQQLTQEERLQSVESYLMTRSMESLQELSNQPVHRIFMDGSFIAGRAGYGVFVGLHDPRNLSEPIYAEEKDSYVAEVYATRAALKLIYDEIREFETNRRETVRKYVLCTDSETAIGILDNYAQTWTDKEFSTRKAGEELKEAIQYYKYIKQFYARNAAILGDHQFEIEWVKGHVGIEGNEAADQLAKLGAMRS